MTNPSDCPLCKEPASDETSSPDSKIKSFNCRNCRHFAASESQLSILSKKSEDYLRKLSCYTRDCFEENQAQPILTTDNVEKIVAQYVPFPIDEMVRRFLLALPKEAPNLGDKFRFRTNAYYVPLLHAASLKEIDFLKRYLTESQLIKNAGIDTMEQEPNFEITFEGWKQILKEKDFSRSKQAFVAMWYADKSPVKEELEEAYTNGIYPAVRANNFDPFLIKDLPHNDKICDRIEIEIRKSAFLIADVTGSRGGVYWEAGFAKGLGRQVIWLCKKKRHKKDIHFNTRQYPHILWENSADLKRELEDRIKATILVNKERTKQ